MPPFPPLKSPKKKKAPASEPVVSAPTGTSTATSDPSADAAQLAAGTTKIREHLSSITKTLGAAGTAIVGAVGYTQMSDVFPVPPGWEGVALGILAIAGFLAAATGVVVVARVFFQAQRRILLTTLAKRSSTKKEFDFTPEEADLVVKVMDENAREDEARSLRALELRALRFERIARSSKPADNSEKEKKAADARAKRFQAESDRLDDAVTMGLKRASSTLLERRATDAVRGKRTFASLMAVAVGIVTLWASAAISAGERELVNLNKDCAKIGAESEKDLCATVRPGPTTATEDEPTPPTGPTSVDYGDGITGPVLAWAKANRPLVEQLTRITGCAEFLKASGMRSQRSAMVICLQLAATESGPTAGGT